MDSTNNAQYLLQKVRDALNARGPNTIRSLGRVFRQLDSYDGNKKVDRDEFLIGLKENGVTISKQEANALLDYMDTNRDGTLDFNEFLVAIRGEMNATRKAQTDKAFAKFDRDGSGSINASDLKGVYNASAHPKVLKGQMTEDQVFQEFLQSFADANKDGVITKQEWDEYYNSVSANIDDDQHFVELMKSCWKL